MAERTTVTQTLQIGVETTPGTGVAAGKSLPSITIDPAIKANIDKFRPTGNKFQTIHALGKEWVEAKIGGEPTYSELHYLLASLLQYTAPVQQGATTAYLWAHGPSSTGEDTVKTYTVEQGSSLRAHKFTYGLVSELSMSGDRDKLELSGMMLGQALTDGITMTGTPAALEQIPILPKELDVYLDTTSGGLGTTKLTRLLRWGVDIKSRFGPLWVVNSANASWVTHVETPVDAQVKLLVEANSDGMGLLTPLRDGSTRFVRIEGTSGQNAGTAIPYSLTMDFALQVADVSEFRDEDGVYAIEYTFDVVHDGTWGKALTASTINKATAL